MNEKRVFGWTQTKGKRYTLRMRRRSILPQKMRTEKTTAGLNICNLKAEKWLEYDSNPGKHRARRAMERKRANDVMRLFEKCFVINNWNFFFCDSIHIVCSFQKLMLDWGRMPAPSSLLSNLTWVPDRRCMWWGRWPRRLCRISVVWWWCPGGDGGAAAWSAASPAGWGRHLYLRK